MKKLIIDDVEFAAFLTNVLEMYDFYNANCPKLSDEKEEELESIKKEMLLNSSVLMQNIKVKNGV